jgi:hypothetical protein
VLLVGNGNLQGNANLSTTQDGASLWLFVVHLVTRSMTFWLGYNSWVELVWRAGRDCQHDISVGGGLRGEDLTVCLSLNSHVPGEADNDVESWKCPPRDLLDSGKVELESEHVIRLMCCHKIQ